MSKLIVTVGPSPSGKTTFARAQAKQLDWKYASRRVEALHWLEQGFNVVLDEERHHPNEALGFGLHEVEIKRFATLTGTTTRTYL